MYGDGLNYRWLEAYKVDSVTEGYMNLVQCQNVLVFIYPACSS